MCFVFVGVWQDHTALLVVLITVVPVLLVLIAIIFLSKSSFKDKITELV